MKDNLINKAAQLLLKKRRRKRWHKILSLLAAVVMFVTTYILILPAITLEVSQNDFIGTFMYEAGETIAGSDNSADNFTSDVDTDLQTTELLETDGSSQVTAEAADDYTNSENQSISSDETLSGSAVEAETENADETTGTESDSSAKNILAERGIMTVADDEAEGADTSFTLTYGNYTVTFYVVDTSGNPISGSYSSYSISSADAATKYVFGATADSYGTQMDIPELKWYTFSSAHLDTYNGQYTVVSVATAGYTDDVVTSAHSTAFRFFVYEPTQSGQFYTRGNANVSVYLVYEEKTAETFTITNGDYVYTCYVVDENGNAISGQYENITLDSSTGSYDLTELGNSLVSSRDLSYISLGELNSGNKVTAYNTSDNTFYNGDTVVENSSTDIYFVYSDLATYETVSYRMWLWLTSYGGTDGTGSTNLSGALDITDAVKKTDASGGVYYLIPISYFTQYYSTYGYKFDETAACPIRYAPDANSATGNITSAAYVYYQGEPYVQVQDTGSYGSPPRNNIYFTEAVKEPGYYPLNDLILKLYTKEYNPDSTSGSDKYDPVLRVTYDGNTDVSTDTETHEALIEGAVLYIDTDYAYHYYIPAEYLKPFESYGYTVGTDEGEAGLLSTSTGSPDTEYVYLSFDTDGNPTDEGDKTLYLTFDDTVSRTEADIYYTVFEVAADALTPASTVINLFDYWLTERDASDAANTSSLLEKGINEGHALKFIRDTNDGYAINQWTGSKVLPRQGIVDVGLDDNYYPTLSGNTDVNGVTSTESLDYLFDPDIESDYKKSFTNVGNLLRLDDNGYYYFSCYDRYAHFNEDTNSFVEYTSPGSYYGNTYGQFFPFADISNAYNKSADNGYLNHFFGMTVTSRFIQKYNGYTDNTKQQATTFEFIGDDDVWVFIDGVLVGDVGGIHDAAHLNINFATGEVAVSVYADETQVIETSIADAFNAAGMGDELEENEDGYTTLKNNSTHVLSFYFLERGNYASNLMLKYNLTTIPETSVKKVDQYGNPLEGAVFGAYEAIEAKANPGETVEYYYVTDDVVLDAAEEGKRYYISLNEAINATYLPADERKRLEGGKLKVYDEETYEVTESEGSYYYKINLDKTSDTFGDITVFRATPEDENIFGELAFSLKSKNYVGTTDVNGRMIFVDEYGSPLSVAEICQRIGETFILREIYVPEGYRTVVDEVYLRFENDRLECDNIYSSGVWASNNIQVTAANTLYTKNGEFVEYYSPVTLEDGTVTGKVNGTLFAVILKKNDKVIDSSNPGLGSTDWYPVYGSNEAGYVVSDKSDLENIIEAAKKSQEYGSTVFEYSASGMQVTVVNIPGKIRQYYSYYLETKDDPDNIFTSIDDVEYITAFYWTSADSIEGATVGNTQRVYAYGATAEETGSAEVDAFEFQFGSDIEVTNYNNRLYVQKTDEQGNLLNDAVFAIYSAGQDDADDDGDGENDYYYIADDGTYIYLEQDSDGDGSGRAYIKTTVADNETTTTEKAYGTYTVDKTTGVITTVIDGTAYTLTPSQTAVTNSASIDEEAVTEEGTSYFDKLITGYYLVREINPPTGYRLNGSDIPVVVSETAVYANAGTHDNGISVGNGAGYLANTLDIFGDGSVDKTFKYVYSILMAADPTATFDDIYSSSSTEDSPFYMVDRDYYNDQSEPKENMTPYEDLSDEEKAAAKKAAAVTYLEYYGAKNVEDDVNMLFDYIVNTDDYARENTGEGTGRLRFYLNYGWSALTIYQDTEYLEYSDSDTDYAYYDEIATDITNLFSNSTFINVENELLKDLNVYKTDKEGSPLSGAEFTLYFINDLGEKVYYAGFDEDTLSAVWTTDESKAVILTTDSEGKAQFKGLINTTYYLTEIKPPENYYPIEGSIEITLTSDSISTTADWEIYGIKTEVVEVKTETEETDTDNTDTDNTDTAAALKYYNVYVPNYVSRDVPTTGGWGEKPLMLGGCILLLTALGGYVLRRYIHERRLFKELNLSKIYRQK